MKTRFLDARNCHKLLPQGHGLPLAQHLEGFLHEVNDTECPTKGSIDRLIEHNKKTQATTRGSARYLNSLLEVSQIADAEGGRIDAQAGVRQKSGPAKYHTTLIYKDHMAWKIIIPLQFILKGWGDADKGYQGYTHVLAHNLENSHTYADLKARAQADSDEYYYVGLTGRNWLTRLSEHIGEMRRGSRRAFYQEWRRSLNMRDVLFVSSLIDINMTYEEAMEWEEIYVDQVSYGPNGLNMIPGGFKGQQLLHKARLLSPYNKSLRDREAAIAEYVKRHSRKGIPNPFMVELWKDDAHYRKVNESNPKRLLENQVIHIRELDQQGYSVRDITKIVGALDQQQVKRVIERKTYTRVR